MEAEVVVAVAVVLEGRGLSWKEGRAGVVPA